MGEGSELGDLCVFMPLSRPPDIGAAAQRYWSNQAARAGSDPCVPTGLAPYFLAVPKADAKVRVGAGRYANGLVVPFGESRTIEVKLVAQDGAAPPGPIVVSAFQLSSIKMDAPPSLDFAWDRTVGAPGDVLHLTVKAVAQKSVSKFFVKATRDGDSTWAPAVVVPR